MILTKEIHKDLKIKDLGKFAPARANLASVFQQDLVLMVILEPKNLKNLKILTLRSKNQSCGLTFKNNFRQSLKLICAKFTHLGSG
jgi:hypothetical protein